MHQRLRVKKKFVLQGRSLFCARSVLPVRERSRPEEGQVCEPEGPENKKNPLADFFNIPRRLITTRMTWIIASLLFAFGSWLIGQGAWIHIKAETAQWLLERAWQKTLITQQSAKPWPWADTWPVGRLIVPRLNIDQIILGNTSGQSLAFGPGKVPMNNTLEDDPQGMILSGHRDTHFSFLQDLRQGDRIQIQTPQGAWQNHVIQKMDVVDSRIQPLTVNERSSNLRLITCYPFDAIQPGGPLRYVVSAQ